MQVFDFQNAQSVASGAHRGAAMNMSIFPCFTDSTGSNFLISMARLPAGRFSPLHRHNFDQVRFMLSGSSNYGEWTLTAGECGYFPESIVYGPQRQHEEADVLTLQLPGDSGAYYPTPAELDAAVARLKARDPDFGKDGVGTGADGAERDAFEMAWEEITGEPVSYAAQRYAAPIVMKPDSFAWHNDEAGRDIRHLGTFGDSRLGISMARVADGRAIGTASGTEFWFLVEGAVHWQGVDYGPRTGFFFDGADAPDAAPTGSAAFLVITFPERQNAADE